MSTTLSHFEMTDWLSGDALVLALRGRLDAGAARAVGGRIRELTRRPGSQILVDLAGVTDVDAPAAEDLFLEIVSVHAQRAIIVLTGAQGPCHAVLAGLGLAGAAPRRQAADRPGFGRFHTGVTA